MQVASSENDPKILYIWWNTDETQRVNIVSLELSEFNISDGLIKLN
jgi:hypothetical protein